MAHDGELLDRVDLGTPTAPFLGEIGTGVAETAPSLAEQLTHIRALYDEGLSHYGVRVGLRHVRKHLGWALDVAAGTSGAPAATLKEWRQAILTSDDPASVHRSLERAYDDFAWSAAA